MKKINILAYTVSMTLCISSVLLAMEKSPLKPSIKQNFEFSKAQRNKVSLDEIKAEIQNSLDYMDNSKYSLKLLDELIQKRKLAGFNKEGTPNKPYHPFWNNPIIANWLKNFVFPWDKRTIYFNVFKEPLESKPGYKNPNAYKLFGPTESYMMGVCFELRDAFQKKMNVINTVLQDYTNYFNVFQKDSNKNIAEKKDQIKADLQRKLTILELLMDELTEINSYNVRFIDKRFQSDIMKFPQIMDLSHGIKNREIAIVLDAFRRNAGLSDIDHPALENIILPDAKNENVTCGKKHSCHVTGIIHDLAPFAYVVPKIAQMSDERKRAVSEILKQDYGAKVINISSQIEATELQDLCKNHIVVVALGNTADVGDFKIREALENSENVRKHLLVVVNTMPDGQTISPTSSFPGKDPYPAVAAPGEWIESTIPTPKKHELEATWAEHRKKRTIPPSDKLSYGWFEEQSGTSQAAPAVTAAVLWILSEFPELSLEEVVSVIKDSANREGELANKELFGYGLVDVQAAFKLAEEKVKARQSQQK